MKNKFKNIIAVDIYLEKRKTREYVGRLSRKNSNFIFTYSDAYIYKEKAISLGPDLPLSTKKFISKKLFPSFEDRIPSSKNPAYPEYCKMVGINKDEKDLLILVATIGQKGASSFVFAPVFHHSITSNDIIKYRKHLHLTVREFCELFDIATSTLHRIEKNKTSGKDTLKRLEIYLHFPKVALYEIMKNGDKINETKRNLVEKILQSDEKFQALSQI